MFISASFVEINVINELIYFSSYKISYLYLMNSVISLTLFRKPTKEMSTRRNATFVTADNFEKHAKFFAGAVSRGNSVIPRKGFVHRLMFRACMLYKASRQIPKITKMSR